ncbi:endonuclease/exonuclease/phosphatase family protein [Archangium violaceum]|uniref:endonuclease/exonuclease/phosphatase family protein n=1 Tax=Archangium violaceum TaxID=83451 RepID=UPI00193BC942|nr:endonuclease/exonuclease/phosphatase family protein [Archangium violaceum]QRK08948.1 endonuclease/exonuclease/phosphatase family protein [Archangium violaceum]
MLRVLTLNIAHGVPSIPVPLPFLLPRGKLLGHLDQMAGLLARENADVVALQEVDRAGLFSGTVDPLERLATRAGYAHMFHGAHLHLPGLCTRGTALLSHRPLLETDSRRFEEVASIDKGYVVAAVEDEDRLLDVVSTHLDFASERRRQQQAVHIIEALQRRPHRPRLVMGDMNSRQGNPGVGIERMMKQLALHTPEPGGGEPTYEARAPTMRLDWILASPELRFTHYHPLAERVSDHLALKAELEWTVGG